MTGRAPFETFKVFVYPCQFLLTPRRDLIKVEATQGIQKFFKFWTNALDLFEIVCS